MKRRGNTTAGFRLGQFFDLFGQDFDPRHLPVHANSDLMKSQIQQQLFCLVNHSQFFRRDEFSVNEPACQAGEALFVPRIQPQTPGKLPNFIFTQTRLPQWAEYSQFGDSGQSWTVIAVVVRVGGFRDQFDAVESDGGDDFFEKLALAQVTAVSRVVSKTRDVEFFAFQSSL